ncbi:unnamed protein product [Prorocentrum cordatum]|uniref:Uncharacterized protein n=1 Tax=Prorocentrum cordatum TaxID=2364126 RepID=A0ABN9WSW6_9DINO|nr:unnamed protein product [Polarella glacialis]
MTATIARDDQICAEAAGVWYSGSYSERDDADFTAAEMCCICGGGRLNVKSSAECWDRWTEDCTAMPRENLAWFRYVRGLFQYLYTKPGFEDGVKNVVNEDYVGIAPSEREAEVIVQSITLGWFFRMLATSSDWEIAPGIPHPRGLTGCAFLASYEIAALLNLDLCNPVEGTSIKSERLRPLPPAPSLVLSTNYGTEKNTLVHKH